MQVVEEAAHQNNMYGRPSSIDSLLLFSYERPRVVTRRHTDWNAEPYRRGC